jgi:hypothetical protein
MPQVPSYQPSDFRVGSSTGNAKQAFGFRNATRWSRPGKATIITIWASQNKERFWIRGQRVFRGSLSRLRRSPSAVTRRFIRCSSQQERIPTAVCTRYLSPPLQIHTNPPAAPPQPPTLVTPFLSSYKFMTLSTQTRLLLNLDCPELALNWPHLRSLLST